MAKYFYFIATVHRDITYPPSADLRRSLPDRPDEPTFIGDQDPRHFEISLRDEYHRCMGVTDEQKNIESMQWLRQAAEAGFLPAVDRLNWVLYEQGDIEGSRQYLEIAWQMGSPLALGGLYEIATSDAGGIGNDPVLAAAYLYLSVALFEAQHPIDARGRIVRRMAQRKGQLLHDELRGLSATQVDSAIAVARDLLRGNPSCCVDW